MVYRMALDPPKVQVLVRLQVGILWAKRGPASVPESTAVFETARRGSIPRRGTNILGVWRIAYDPAKVGDQVRLLTRMLTTLELDGQATGCNPVEVGSIPTGVF
jgi:hypothetical protein